MFGPSQRLRRIDANRRDSSPILFHFRFIFASYVSQRDLEFLTVYTLCLKKTTMTFYAITSMHINRF